MTDETRVTDSGQTPPTLDDIADVVARTNRGLLAIEKTMGAFFNFTSIMFGVVLALLFHLVVMGRVKV